MNGIIFDLKSFRRDRLNGMSQEEFAKQIGISQDKVSRMESDPSQISLEVLINIARQFGMTLDELVSLPKPTLEQLSVDYTWVSAEYIRRTLLDYVRAANLGDTYIGDITELTALIGKSLRKPKVAFIGRSDVGKSTMINALLGTSRMPAYWTPATAIAVYIKHINDRPAFMDEDVWIFRSDDDKEVWDDTRLADEAYCRSLRLSSGNYDLLNTYGTREGENFAESDATAAVVFLDSSLLLNCDFVDLPGYGTGDRFEDDALSLREKSKADVIVYLSIANGFMRSEDISYIKEAIPSLPRIGTSDGADIKPLENLFIVASQAHVIDNGNMTELEHILTNGCERFERSLSEGFWTGNEKPENLRERFFIYSSNSLHLREHFQNAFRRLIEDLPEVVEQRAKQAIHDWAEYKDSEITTTIAAYDALLEDKQHCEDALKEYDRNEPKRHSAFQRARHKVTEGISKFKRESRSEIADYYSDTITVNNLISLMESRDVQRKKEDIQIFSSYISGLLQDKMNDILKAKSDSLAKNIDEFLESFEMSTAVSFEVGGSFQLSTFNKEQAFAAGLAGAATYGALAVWAASCGNLGGYILVAKGVSLLSALGISVGGTAAATSAVASIGGPVVLGAALALIAAITVFAALSGSWRKSVAKKLVEAFNSERILDKLQSSMDTYWGDTLTAFNASADSLDKEWVNHIEQLRHQLQSYDVNAIHTAKREAEMMRNFLENIPL